MNSPQNPDGDIGTEVTFENEHVKVWNLANSVADFKQKAATIGAPNLVFKIVVNEIVMEPQQDWACGFLWE